MNPEHTLEELHDQIASLRRSLEVAKSEAVHYKRVVEWYADPEQWREHKDDRGRDTFTFKFGEDGGFVARSALALWKINSDA